MPEGPNFAQVSTSFCANFAKIYLALNGGVIGVHICKYANVIGRQKIQAHSNIGTITLVVNAVNDAPYLLPIDNVSIAAGETFSYSLQAEDADGDALIYTATVSGGSALTNIEANILTISPQESNLTLNVVVTVTDGLATHSASFLLTVLGQQTTCLDNNSDGRCDHFPLITLIEGSVLLFEREEDVEYTDPGAQ